MMNIPKFRAWDKIDKKMREVKAIEWLNQEFNDDPFIVGFEIGVYSPSTPDCPGEWNEDTLWRKASEVELMPFIGLYDEKCQEIYLSDYLIEEECLHKVTWDCPTFNFLVWMGNDEWEWNGDIETDKDPKYFRVVGNVYENPELLHSEVG